MSHFLREIKEFEKKSFQNLRKLLTSHHSESGTDGAEESEISINEAALHNVRNVKELSSLLAKPELNPNNLNHLGNAPLHTLASRQIKKKYDSLKLDLLYTLLTQSSGVEINLPNAAGNTALHLAVERNDIEFVKTLLAFGANINQLNRQRKTPLDFCLGRFTLMHRTDSLVEIMPINPAPRHSVYSKGRSNGVPPSISNRDNLISLLKECGAVCGRNLVNPSRKPVIKRFVDVVTELEEKRERGSLLLPKKAHCGDESSCTDVAKLYYNLESSTNKLMADVSRSLVCRGCDQAGSQSGNLDQAAALGLQMKEMKLLQMAGSRMLFLDGGGMKGLVEIEILYEIEEQTGRKITELFDWIVGTSSGGIIALALVYAKLTLREVRQLFYQMKDDVFGNRDFITGPNGTKSLTDVLQKTFGSMTMDEVKFPRVVVTAVHKKTTNLKLHYFSNHPKINENNEERLVWKVARYTSAAPMFFDEEDNYVDGGVIANNPCSSGLTRIQDMYRKSQQKLPISLVVSVGSGQMPEDDLGRTDAHQFLFFGKHWFSLKDRLISRISNLVTLLGNAITESENIAENVRSRCIEQGIDYYRFSPHLDEIVTAGETDTQKLLEMVLRVRKCSRTKYDFERLILRFPQYSDANQKVARTMWKRVRQSLAAIQLSNS